MWGEIISLASSNGLWAVLFCLLFLYEIKDSRKREHKYQETVAKLTKSTEIMRDVREDCAEIKEDIKSLKTMQTTQKKKPKQPQPALTEA